jgi:hypothetical protein
VEALCASAESVNQAFIRNCDLDSRAERKLGTIKIVGQNRHMSPMPTQRPSDDVVRGRPPGNAERRAKGSALLPTPCHACWAIAF